MAALNLTNERVSVIAGSGFLDCRVVDRLSRISHKCCYLNY
jgi:hypothetical protein